jgi:hypothetical protein
MCLETFPRDALGQASTVRPLLRLLEATSSTTLRSVNSILF